MVKILHMCLALQNYGEDDYLLFDCPGQIELYNHLSVFKTFVDYLKQAGFCRFWVAGVGFVWYVVTTTLLLHIFSCLCVGLCACLPVCQHALDWVEVCAYLQYLHIYSKRCHSGSKSCAVDVQGP